MRFSGHETFPLRFAWLPKAYRALVRDPSALADYDGAMVDLGVGKNMVRAIRFWVVATAVVRLDGRAGYRSTSFGDLILGDTGHDRFLEDIRTLWLIHWKLCQNVDDPIFAWDYLINRWHLPEISASQVLPVMRREAELVSGRLLSDVTLSQHLDVFLRTYASGRGRLGDGPEDELDSPLVELGFLSQVGERPLADSARREALFAFTRDRKPEITQSLFTYCLHDFWRLRHAGEAALDFREVAVGHGGPGQVFKLPEDDLRERLDAIRRDSNGRFEFRESAARPHVTRLLREDAPEWGEPSLLEAVYAKATATMVPHV